MATTTPTVLGFELAWRAASSKLREAVETLAADLMASRARRTASQHREGFVSRTELVICNLVALHLARSDAWLAAPRGHDAAALIGGEFGRQFTAVLDALIDRGFIEQTEWYFDGRKRVPSHIRATQALLARLPGQLSWQDVELLPRQLIELRSVKDAKGHYELLPFTPTAETQRWEAEVSRIRELMASDSVTFDGSSSVIYVANNELSSLRRLYTPHHKGRVYRFFWNAHFKYGGRLNDGWYFNLPKAERHRLRIDSEPIVSVDYSSLFPRLAYAHAGSFWPFDASDPYAIDGYPRDGLKKLTNSLLCARKALSGRYWPGKTKTEQEEVASMFPSGTKASAVYRAIKAKHARIASLFGSGIGDELFRIESDLVIETVLELAARGIVALPLHDAVLVATSNADKAAQEMQLAGIRRKLLLTASVSSPYTSAR
jgi:hypothetical protein